MATYEKMAGDEYFCFRHQPLDIFGYLWISLDIGYIYDIYVILVEL
jgi:hypothetical protein